MYWCMMISTERHFIILSLCIYINDCEKCVYLLLLYYDTHPILLYPRANTTGHVLIEEGQPTSRIEDRLGTALLSITKISPPELLHFGTYDWDKFFHTTQHFITICYKMLEKGVNFKWWHRSNVSTLIKVGQEGLKYITLFGRPLLREPGETLDFHT